MDKKIVISGIEYDILSETQVSAPAGKTALILKRPKGQSQYIAFRDSAGRISSPVIRAPDAPK